MPRTSAFTLIWLTEKACYELFEREAPLPVNVEDESWFTWLSTHTSFAFQGRYGHLLLLKEERTRGEGGYWYAYRSQKGRTRKKYVGRSSDLNIARLEEIARGISQGRYVARQKSEKQVDMVSHAHIPLLLPKLRIPQTGSTLIRRERLLHKLDAGLECQIILLSAPAGFGKTTLVAQWITHRDETLLLPTPAWISLDAGDNDPIRFWRYIITACSIWGKDLGKAALARLQAFQEPPFFPSPLETALTIFLNELPQEDAQQILVLEDYQVISSPRVHETLSFFIDHLPANVHCILISRGDPALPLIKWRARGQLNELHADELRFSEQETASFLQQAVDLPLSTKMLARLGHQLEGWAAGLRLVALTLQKQMSPEKLEQFLGNFSGSHRAILQYFVSEVLESQSESIRLFLLLTSILDRLTGSLCDAITGRQDSGKVLETLERAHLFLEPLDESGQWYRYHALFVEAMQYEAQQRFSEEILLAAAATASRWYEQHNLLAEAIEMAFLARETERCALLIEQISQDVAYTQHSSELYTLQRWLAQLPEEILQQHPLLCLNYVSALLFGTPAELSSTPPSSLFEQLLSMAEQNLQTRPDLPLLGLTFALRSLVFWRQGMLTGALSSAEQALLWLKEE
ncbi:MAG TPA: transcriptional regulator, partial [Ktedonobacteraceae bacterium]|nr:transcriptional regulator [Ktedonobacteraceae bacterium]